LKSELHHNLDAKCLIGNILNCVGSGNSDGYCLHVLLYKWISIES